MRKRAIITGLAGQDGSYLAEFLLGKGYEIFGLEKTADCFMSSNLAQVRGKAKMVEADLATINIQSLLDIVNEFGPDEFYNLAALSAPGESWKKPDEVLSVNALSVVRILEAVRLATKPLKLYQASSSEIFGQAPTAVQNEATPLHPVNPYGISKAFAYSLVGAYRAQYSLFVASGITFNHESVRRPINFVARKITHGVAAIKTGKAKNLILGNLEVQRDWGFAPDYIEAMWLMLQASVPQDFVIATGQSHSVKDFCRIAFESVGLNWQDYVIVDPTLVRSRDIACSIGDYSKIKNDLGWSPKTKFEDMVKLMVDNELAAGK